MIELMPRLVIAKKSSYDYPRLRDDVVDILTQLDRGTITRGCRVLVKPNLLAAARAEQAVVTHPMVVRAVCEYAASAGADVLVADSPPMGSFDKLVSACGYTDALKGLPVTLRELRAPEKPTELDEKFRDVLISPDALEADVIVNLPKLKTHSQMGMTLAVKNLFGCVFGLSKGEWHMRVGENREVFAELLARIYARLRPAINLMDGILAMQGDGPSTGGTPRELGLLIGSDEAVALDAAICRMIGHEPDWLPTNRAVAALGIDTGYTLKGELPAIKDFKVPAEGELLFGPKFLKHFLRHHITTRPVCIEGMCQMCEECIRMCPAGALGAKHGRLEFEYEQCIRCYCCFEVCPHGAMKKHSPMPGRVLRWLLGGYRSKNINRHRDSRP